MDGVSKAQLQVQNGTRPIVDLLNELRIYYGYDRVEVRTPIVESRMRAGLVPARPLVVVYSTDKIELTLTVSCGYPSSGSMTVQLAPIPPFGLQQQDLQDLTQRCQDIAGNGSSGKDTMASMLAEISHVVNSSDDCAVDQPSSSALAVADDLDDTTGDLPSFYHCRKCRYQLFDSLSFHDHSHLPNANPDGCTSFFLEEAPAYLAIDGLDGGKINCPKCTSRVGAWSWIGTTCSCNAWIAPAFQITKSKVDRKG